MSQDEVRRALSQGSDRHALRSRQAHRLRSHAAILHQIENRLHSNALITATEVVRWYTCISAGLSTTALAQPAVQRLEAVVRRMNTPPLGLRAAVEDVVDIYRALLEEPLVPSFNGILARLLLRYHLGQCGLPPVIFDPQTDREMAGSAAMTRRLLNLLEGEGLATKSPDRSPASPR